MRTSVVLVAKLCLVGLTCVLLLWLHRHVLSENYRRQHIILNVASRVRIDTVDQATAALHSTAIEMERRRNRAWQVCQKLDYLRVETRLPRALVSVHRAAVYCPVEKTASTFFRRWMFQLEHSVPMRSPFEVPVKLVYGCPSMFTTLRNYARQLTAKRRQTMTLLNKRNRTPLVHTIRPVTTIDNFLRKSTRFLFVRDPYTRLFSAFVDKLLAPNPYHWHKWGKPAILRNRKNPSNLSVNCGHDVTFQEFLSFVIVLNFQSENSDPHLRPIVQMCRPCSFNYTVIGHMDTFQMDVTYLSSLLNLTQQLDLDKMAGNSAIDAIEDSVGDAFSIWSSQIGQCITKLEAAKRIWTKLQYRGVINGQLQFPIHVDADSIEYMDANDLIQLVTNALSSSPDVNELRQQKRDAFLNAYKSVNVDILEQIAHMYEADFNVFGFQAKPAEIFLRDT